MIEHLWNDNILWRILELPIGWRIWVLWLMAVNTACILYLNRKPAKIVGIVWLGNIITMMTMYWLLGYVRLLGLSHVIWWTPLVVWLARNLFRGRPSGSYSVWLYLLLISNVASLVIDYIDVIRYFLGDTAPL